MDYLCTCNNCDKTFIDMNPKADAYTKFNTENYKELKQVSDKGEVIWACPICLTDEYLKDL